MTAIAEASALPLKPRQQAAHDAVFAYLDAGVTRQLVALPTGVGKTVLACHIARRFPRALFLCHRQELVEQTAHTMARIDPDRVQGTIAPGRHAIAPFTVGMIQSVHRRLGRIDPDAFDLLIIDEAHHAAARTWRTVADHFTPRLRLGLSATHEETPLIQAQGKATMSNDFHVSVVAWSGRLSELAARFNMPADVLAKQLRRLSNAPPIRGNLIVPVDSPTAIHTLRYRLRLAMVED